MPVLLKLWQIFVQHHLLLIEHPNIVVMLTFDSGRFAFGFRDHGFPVGGELPKEVKIWAFLGVLL